MDPRPLILVTNDDGIFSPGLKACCEALDLLGDLLIVAPRFQQTSMARSFPKNEDSGIIENINININGKNRTAYGVHGSPAMAVSHGILEIADRKPDICISGINYGENIGLCLSCSGTLGACYEADSYGIKSIAISREVPLDVVVSRDYEEFNWDASKETLIHVLKHILKYGFPEDVSIFNINVPDKATKDTEIRKTRQSRISSFSFIKPDNRDFNTPFSLSSKLDTRVYKSEKNSDAYAFYCDKVISITPLTWDFSIDTHWNIEQFDKR